MGRFHAGFYRQSAPRNRPRAAPALHGRLHMHIQTWFKRPWAGKQAGQSGFSYDRTWHHVRQRRNRRVIGRFGAAALIALALASAAAAQPERPRPASGSPRAAEERIEEQAWRRMPVRPGGGTARRTPIPRRGANQCVPLTNVAAAQLFGDRAIELTMKGGRRWRMILAEECPGLSFYQGFYYQPKRAGQLCAGRDAIGARSGGECGIAAIVPVGRPIRKRRR
jgi:hypothetical protein